MKNFFIILCLFFAFCADSFAQAVVDVQRGHGRVDTSADVPAVLSAGEARAEYECLYDSVVDYVPADTMGDSLGLTFEDNSYFRPTIFTLASPDTPFGAWSTWDIHSGLNVMLNAGVTIGFGRDNPFRNGAFFTNASAIYAKQINDRWTVGLGGYLSRFSMSHDSYNDFGLQALASYKINERMNATFYGLHSFAPQDNPLFCPSIFGQASTTIGAQLDVKVNDVVSFQVGVSRTYTNGGRGWGRHSGNLRETGVR